MCEKYNGFTNRETWLVGVHGFFDDDRVEEALRDAMGRWEDIDRNWTTVIANDPELGGVPRAITLWLAGWMEIQMDDYLHECLGDNLPSIVTDLMGDHRINWLEIAEHYSEHIGDVLQEVTA